MIRQTKTAIKELTAQYRAVLKHAFFAGIAAVAVVSTANAADPVTMEDVINSANTQWAEYADEAGNPAEDTIGTYAYKKANGDNVNASGGVPTDKFEGEKAENTTYAVSSTATGDVSYIGSGLSAATELVGEGDAKTIAYSAYTYKNGRGDTITLGESAATFTDNVNISAYTNVDGDTISVTGGVDEPTVAYDKFSFSYGTKTYTLVDDTTVNDGESNILITSISNETVKALATSLSNSHADAQAVVNGVQTELNVYANTEATNYATATGIVAADTTLVKTAQANYDGYSNAYDNYHTALDAYDAYAAYKPYAESLGKVIDDRSNDVVADAIVTTTDIETAGEDPAKIAELISDDKAASTAVLAGILTDKETKLSEQLGYNVGNNPENDDKEKAPKSLVNSLTMNEGKTEGKVTSVVGAINANTDAVAQVRSDAEAAWGKAQDWISQELGYNTTETDAKTKLKEAGFTSTDFLGAVKENKGAIATETAARSEADINILKLAMAESNARKTEEQRIETESKDRDDALKTRMDEGQKQVAALFTAEINERKAEDETLQANIDAEAAARSEADETLQANIDNEVATARAAEKAIRDDFTANDAVMLQSANAYTDKKVDTLEKNVSGGVAAATALSAVEVSNVKKGEMSVGGGYGYYNGQSAVAVGAALGLCDSWSVNAGAGIAQGDKTQFSVRAGANYKFKLF